MKRVGAVTWVSFAIFISLPAVRDAMSAIWILVPSSARMTRQRGAEGRIQRTRPAGK